MPLSSNDADTLKAHLDGVDAAARNAEQDWGVDRLPLLVTAEMRARFYTAERQWSEAMEAAWNADILTRDMLDLVARKSEALKRGWAALAAAASEAGERPLRPEFWETRLHSGEVAVIVQTNAEAAAVIASGRCLNVWTLAEIANVIDALPPALAQAKTVFPGAKVQPPRADRSWVRMGDDIPF